MLLKKKNDISMLGESPCIVCSIIRVLCKHTYTIVNKQYPFQNSKYPIFKLRKLSEM